MLTPNFGQRYPTSRHNLFFGGINQLSNHTMQNPKMKFEEDDSTSYTVPEAEGELGDWWDNFHNINEYPIYCMILATEADENIALLVENHREELANIAGDRCCIIYFRDIEKGKLLEPFHFTEHAKGVQQFIKIINMKPSRLPGMLFFENITSGKYVYVGLKSKSIHELMDLTRELFSFLYSHKKVSLAAARTYKFSNQIKITSKAFAKNLAKIGTDLVFELFKSLVPFPKIN